jgi:phosphoglycolate phosphatase
VTARLVLFDIDGTLLRQGNRVHGRAIVQACTELTGHDITKHFGVIDSGGRTDRYIVSELLRRCGVKSHEVEELFPQIAARSVELTGAGLRTKDPGWALPGGPELIARLIADGISVGLVTGNLPEIAQIKLDCASLWEPFADQVPLVTGFGDLSENRNDLSAAAFAQAQRDLASDIDPTNVIIVGDTHRDVECAHAIGARCLGVTTGRYSTADLAAEGCEIIVESLVDVAPADLWQ